LRKFYLKSQDKFEGRNTQKDKFEGRNTQKDDEREKIALKESVMRLRCAKQC